MLSAMDSGRSPVLSSSTVEEHYVAHSVCSHIKANPIEANLDDSCDEEAFESSHPSSMASSGGALCTSATLPDRLGGHAARPAGERERFLVSHSPTLRLHQRPDATASLGGPASARGPREVLSSSTLRADRQRKLSATARTPPPPTPPPPSPPPTLLPAMLPRAPLHASASPLQRSSSALEVRGPSPGTSGLRTPAPTEESEASVAHLLPATPVKYEPAAAAPSPHKPSVAASDDADVCCICLEEYTSDNPMFRGACQHHFHLPCLMEWKQRSNSCPMCCAETLRGVGEFEASQHDAPADPAEAARLRAVAERDAEIAHRLQHRYLRQAQRRGSQDSHAAHAAHMSYALHRTAPVAATGRAPPSLGAAPRHTAVNTPPPAGAVSGPAQQQANAAAARAPARRSRRAQRAPERSAETLRGRSTPPPTRPATNSSRRPRTKSQAGCSVM
ncbi:Zinc finger C3HC4 type (RING finger) containing protein [Novymonas esmeraldas]|uniref:RING-type E3 ubiquitin transferase n=1 Tax=Novymonas esmeraldas TaxID=1808958 RepID=A0AAW0F0C3_9TRYP